MGLSIDDVPRPPAVAVRRPSPTRAILGQDWVCPYVTAAFLTLASQKGGMMKRIGLGVVIMAAATALGLLAFWPKSVSAGGKLVDHTFMNQAGPQADRSMECGTKDSRPFLVFIAVRAVDGFVTMRVRFQDGTYMDYPLKRDQVFSLQEAAGDEDSVDNVITVTKAPDGTGSLVGWMSASRAPETQAHVSCSTS
jgi:hypothetical protein